ncbi:MAG: hypothetical protein D6706_02220 [Chloroflexi bacterium]|nr:MAG: hypothetical protein D6706_02220 [Chloroflexota bacterium]
MNHLKGLYKISRPLSTLTGALAVLVGGYVAGTGAWVQVVLASITTVLVSASANAWNDYLDVEIDRINQPQRPLPAGMLSPRAALLYSFALAILSLITASFIGLSALAIAFVANLLLYIYSWKLKSTVLMGNATIALISALSAIFGGVAAGNPLPTLWLALIIGSGIMGREVLKTLADYEGDLRQHCRTIATTWGRRKARVVFYLLAALTLVMMMVPYLFNVFRPIYAYIVAIGVYPVVFYILLRVTQYRTGPQLERLSQLMKYDFLVWFLAVLLGAAR